MAHMGGTPDNHQFSAPKGIRGEVSTIQNEAAHFCELTRWLLFVTWKSYVIEEFQLVLAKYQ